MGCKNSYASVVGVYDSIGTEGTFEFFFCDGEEEL